MCIEPGRETTVLVGIDEIAAYLRRSRGVVRRMVHNGELPVVLKHGAFMSSQELLKQWLEKEATQDDMQMT